MITHDMISANSAQLAGFPNLANAIMSAGLFSTITPEDWKRSLSRSRGYTNDVSEQIKQQLSPPALLHRAQRTDCVTQPMGRAGD